MGHRAKHEVYPEEEIQKLAEHLAGGVNYLRWSRKLPGGSEV